MSSSRTLMFLNLLIVSLVPICKGQAVNKPPQFVSGGDMLNFALDEDATVGRAVYTLKARDPEGSRIFYAISGDYFSVNANTGVVTLVRPLDRERQDRFTVIISITDDPPVGSRSDPNTVSLRREIRVEDVNDNPPQFLDTPYRFSVKETAEVGSTLFAAISVKDRDVGANSDIKLSCASDLTPEDCDTFAVFGQKLVEGTFLGIITLRKKLDYESRKKFAPIIRAEDQADRNRRNSTLKVDVQIEDVQDQSPQFLNGPYSVTVPEGTGPGHTIFQVFVKDGDTGKPRDIALEIVGDNEGYFKLNVHGKDENSVQRASVVTSTKLINRENPIILNAGGLYTFQIRAKEVVGPGEVSEETVSNVTIVVIDEDDEIPVFNSREFTVSVPENIGKDNPLPGLNIVVSDNDVSKNAEFSLELENVNNSEGIFSVYPQMAIGRTPVIIRVADPNKLDYENAKARSFVFRVVAKQGEKHVTSATVKVLVKDANDNVPQFDQHNYEYSVPENANTGHLIANLIAQDPDSDSFGSVIYSLRGFGSQKFFVNEATGDIYVSCLTSRTCLDYETQNTYSLTYTATDGGRRATSVNILIRIVDINDNYPVFEKEEYRRIVREGTTSFLPAFFVKAYDADGPTQGGGNVSYTIKSINTDTDIFKIDEITGEITMTSAVETVHTENGRYDLVVRATDKGQPEALHSDIKVFVNVGSISNHAPRFKPVPGVVEVDENAPLNSEVYKVEATDADGPNDQLAYSFLSGTKDNFDIDKNSGLITVSSDATLDIQQNGNAYELVIHATDKGVPFKQTGTVTLNISIKDINNKPPKFIKNSYNAYILESMAIGEEIITVKAEDVDSNSRLKYSIVEPIIARDKTGVILKSIASYDYTNIFEIDSLTGIISLSKSLDYNSVSVVILTIQAKDINADEQYQSQVATTELTIYIQAFNAENPQFASPWTPSNPVINVNISEEQPIASTLFKLSAKDPITGQPVSRFEELIGSDPDDYVQISPLTGDVLNNRVLDYESLNSISFSVKAIAGDPGNERMSEAHVTLFLQDINDHTPIFNQDSYQAEINETATIGTKILQVGANDSDSGEYSEIVYKLDGDGSNMFKVDPMTGEIFVNEKLDREKVPIYNLQVIATDLPNGGSTQKKSVTIVKVIITDANDTPPKFQKLQYTAVVPENSPNGTLVSKIHANDDDLGESGEVTYAFADEGDTKGMFSIDPLTGEVRTRKMLTGKGRQDPYVIRVRALDKGPVQLFGDAEMYIFIGDVSNNDGVPRFIKPTKNEVAYVVENSPISTPVFKAIAYDPDDPNTVNGKILYKFLDDGNFGIIRKVFQIDSVTGVIKTRVQLDREQREQYTLILEARDFGNPPQQASTVLHVIIKDVDDHTPLFRRQRNSPPLEITATEEQAIGNSITEIEAEDLDKGENAEIGYEISYGNDHGIFGIKTLNNNKTVLYLKKRLDREEFDSHLLTIKCYPKRKLPNGIRKQYDKNDMTETQVLILVEDIDDNKPVFTNSNLTLGIRLNVPLYTEIERLKAIDIDGDSNPIKYSIENATFFSPNTRKDSVLPKDSLGFIIDENTGILRTNQTYGKFSDGNFKIFIKAMSNSESGTYLELKIYILKDTELMKFVFTHPPNEVQEFLPQFTKEIENALILPLKLNIYDTQFYSKSEGSLDFGSSSSCFQIVDEKNVISFEETEYYTDRNQNEDLVKIYDNYGVVSVEKCATLRSNYEIDWIEIAVLVIAIFIGVASFVTIIVLCCFFSRYKSQMRRSAPLKIIEAPIPTIVAPSLPPGSMIGGVTPASIAGSENHRTYDWQESVIPHDMASYRNYPQQ